MSETTFIRDIASSHVRGIQQFPDKADAEKFIDELFRFLFINSGKRNNGQHPDEKYQQLKSEFESLLSVSLEKNDDVEKHSSTFFNALPYIYQELLKDAEAILKFDPAAHNLAEVIIAYPGFYATVVYRLSHQIWQQGIQLLPRLFSGYAHSKTGIDIHPAAHIGEAFAIDHGTGIVIGETTRIGNYVKIYQGVTLGALNVIKSEASSKRHPTIEDEVVIYSGATILGGETVIGKGSIIGGNVWLTYSVPSNSVVYHKSEIRIKDKNPFPEPINFII
ncbi:MAG TPA: hypothetical protein VM368_09015 [Flavisolibacter sp.]|nr:hypothetical protein [Flavisolibacter sp.]